LKLVKQDELNAVAKMMKLVLVYFGLETYCY